jgi:hypothetical protein
MDHSLCDPLASGQVVPASQRPLPVVMTPDTRMADSGSTALSFSIPINSQLPEPSPSWLELLGQR